MAKTILNIAGYQAIWLLCVVWDFRGAACSLFLLFVHLYFSNNRLGDLILMGCLLMTGCVVDGILLQFGLFSFTVSGFPIPLWLMAIWLGLATTPNHSLAWMKNKPKIAALFGAMGGPIAYWAGVSLGAAAFHWPLWVSVTTLGVVWGGLWPGIMRLSVLVDRELQTVSKKKKSG